MLQTPQQQAFPTSSNGIPAHQAFMLFYLVYFEFMIFRLGAFGLSPVQQQAPFSQAFGSDTSFTNVFGAPVPETPNCDGLLVAQIPMPEGHHRAPGRISAA